MSFKRWPLLLRPLVVQWANCVHIVCALVLVFLLFPLWRWRYRRQQWLLYMVYGYELTMHLCRVDEDRRTLYTLSFFDNYFLLLCLVNAREPINFTFYKGTRYERWVRSRATDFIDGLVAFIKRKCSSIIIFNLCCCRITLTMLFEFGRSRKCCPIKKETRGGHRALCSG